MLNVINNFKLDFYATDTYFNDINNIPHDTNIYGIKYLLIFLLFVEKHSQLEPHNHINIPKYKQRQNVSY